VARPAVAWTACKYARACTEWHVHVVSCVYDSEFLSRLESCQSDPVLVARCFDDSSDGFSVYSSYCTNYPRYGRAFHCVCTWTCGWRECGGDGR